jgi:hypothetical protein
LQHCLQQFERNTGMPLHRTFRVHHADHSVLRILGVKEYRAPHTRRNLNDLAFGFQHAGLVILRRKIRMERPWRGKAGVSSWRECDTLQSESSGPAAPQV